ncbi:MAG: thioredoxin domain-containing protein [Patescibacteria group bacterium]
MEDRRKILWLLVGLLGVLSVLLVWSEVYSLANTFETGKPPPMARQEALAPTQPAIRPSDPARGSSDPKAVTIVEFADFSCVYCRASEQELRQVLLENKDSVRHVWRDMPVASDNPTGVVAAVAGRCAAEQNRFWDVHELLMSSPSLSLDSVKEMGRTLNLNQFAYEECLNSGRHVQSIQDDVAIAQEHGMTGAPTFFIGKQTLTGYVTAADLRWAILKAKLGY